MLLTSSDVANFLRIGLLIWMAAFAALVCYRLLDGRIRSTGLLGGRRGGAIDPERLQMLVVFPAGIGFYVASAGSEIATAGELGSLPEPPQFLTAAVLGSNALYLAGKLFRRLGKGGTS